MRQALPIAALALLFVLGFALPSHAIGEYAPPLAPYANVLSGQSEGITRTFAPAASPPAGTLQSSSTLGGGAQWTELGPKPISSAAPNYGVAPFSGRVSAIAINASNTSNIYVGGAQGGIWKSLDGGATWSPLTDSQPSLAIGSIVISADSKTIYVGTGEPNHSGDTYYGAGILKSSDGGRTWSTLGASVFNQEAVSKIILSSSDPNRLIVSTTWGECCKGKYHFVTSSGLGVYVSSDGGAAWSRTLASPDSVGISDMALDPTNSNVVWAGDFAGSTWRSADGGATWTQSLRYTQSADQGRVALAMSPASGSTLYAAFANSTGGFAGVFSYQYPNPQSVPLRIPPDGTTAYGGTYTMCESQCNYNLVFAVDPTNANTIYLGGSEIYRSADGGQTWTDLGGYSGGSSIHPDQHALAITPGNPSVIFVGDDGGIWKSSNRGGTWTNMNPGLSLTQFESLAISPSSTGVLIGGTQDNGCVRYDGSSSWREIVGGDGGWTGFESTNPNIMYCSYTHLAFRESTDGGTTWQDATTGINLKDNSLFYAPVAQPNVSCLLYIGGTHLYRTTNCASSWTDVSGAAFGSTTLSAIAAAGNSVVYVGTSAGSLFVSQDGGQTWQKVYSPGPSVTYQPISTVVIDPSNSFHVYFSVPLVGLYSALLQSGTWQTSQLGSPTPATDVLRIDPSTGRLYAGTDLGVYYSSDAGATWANAGVGLPNVAVFDIAISPAGLVYAATHGRGVWVLSPLAKVALTLGYSIQGGGSGFQPPTLNYVLNGFALSTTLGGTPTQYMVDVGSAWGVTNPLSGSSATERWQTNQTASGSASSAQTINLVYYHQYAVSFGYTVSGGGSGYSSPLISFPQFGTTTTAMADAANWVDASGAYSYPAQLTGSSQQERWQTTGQTAGTVSSALSLSLTYYHQFLMSASYGIVGSGTPAPPAFSYASFGVSGSLQLSSLGQSLWADAGSRYSATNPLTGSTASERWYTAGDNGTVTVAGTLSLAYHHQYLLAIIGKPSTSTWLDQGYQASLNFPEVYNRSNGIGLRIASASLDGGSAQTEPLTKGNLTFSITMNGPHTLVFNVVTQYQVFVDAGATKAISSITAPTIQGDTYWYDSGAPVSVVLNGEWGRFFGVGSRLVSYVVNGGPPTIVATSSPVTSLSLSSISARQSVSAQIATQYQLSTPNGSVSTLTAPPIVGDAGWYDSGTPVVISYSYEWSVVPQQSRLAATGYSVDGGAMTSLTEGSPGTFEVAVTMSSAHTVNVQSVVQYFAAFHFTDAAGKRTVDPTALQIAIGTISQPVPGFGIWLDIGTSFTVSSVTYEGVDVRPASGQQYSITAPATITLNNKIYDATLKVTDLLGLGVSGAQVKMTLANGTVLSGSTAGDGTFVAPAIPLGTFTASVSSFGSSSQVTGDASKQNVATTSVLFGTVSLGLLVALAVVAAGSAFLVIRRRSTKGGAKKMTSGEAETRQARLQCPNCGTSVDPSEPFCTNCGTKLR